MGQWTATSSTLRLDRMSKPQAEFAEFTSLSRDGTVAIPGNHAAVAKLTTRLSAASKENVRRGFALLVEDNLDAANAWLAEVGKENPAEAVRLLISLAEFTMPKLKAVAVKVQDPGGGPARTLSISDLERIVSEQ